MPKFYSRYQIMDIRYSKEKHNRKFYTLPVMPYKENYVVSEESVWLIGELTRLQATQRIKLDPKSYEGLPRKLDEGSSQELTDEEEEEIQKKEWDIYFAERRLMTKNEFMMYAEHRNSY